MKNTIVLRVIYFIYQLIYESVVAPTTITGKNSRAGNTINTSLLAKVRSMLLPAVDWISTIPGTTELIATEYCNSYNMQKLAKPLFRGDSLTRNTYNRKKLKNEENEKIK